MSIIFCILYENQKAVRSYLIYSFIDFKKAIFDPETGFLTIPTGTGYDINMRLSPSIKIEEIIGQNGEPGFFAQLNINESNITSTKDPIKTQDALDNYIKKLPF